MVVMICRAVCCFYCTARIEQMNCFVVALAGCAFCCQLTERRDIKTSKGWMSYNLLLTVRFFYTRDSKTFERSCIFYATNFWYMNLLEYVCPSVYLRNLISLRVRSHRTKAYANMKKVKDYAKEIKENISNIKEIFRFYFRFRSL